MSKKLNQLLALQNKQKVLIKEITPLLPKILRASISTYYLKCGKPNCYCRKGKLKHGPYQYLSAKEGNKVQGFLILDGILRQVYQGVGYYNLIWKMICDLCRVNRKILWKTNKNKED